MQKPDRRHDYYVFINRIENLYIVLEGYFQVISWDVSECFFTPKEVVEDPSRMNRARTIIYGDKNFVLSNFDVEGYYHTFRRFLPYELKDATREDLELWLGLNL